MKEDILMQDNQSCIPLQKNYPYSNGKGSKYIHVRYFFVVDIKQGIQKIFHIIVLRKKVLNVNLFRILKDFMY